MTPHELFELHKKRLVARARRKGKPHRDPMKMCKGLPWWKKQLDNHPNMTYKQMGRIAGRGIERGVCSPTWVAAILWLNGDDVHPDFRDTVAPYMPYNELFSAFRRAKREGTNLTLREKELEQEDKPRRVRTPKPR